MQKVVVPVVLSVVFLGVHGRLSGGYMRSILGYRQGKSHKMVDTSDGRALDCGQHKRTGLKWWAERLSVIIQLATTGSRFTLLTTHLLSSGRLKSFGYLMEEPPD